MLKKLKALFQLDKTIKEEEQKLASIRERLSNEERLMQELMDKATADARELNEDMAKQTVELQEQLVEENEKLEAATKELEKQEKAIKRNEKKISAFKHDFQGIQHLIETFPDAVNYDAISAQLKQMEESVYQNALQPIVSLDLKHKESKALRKMITQTNKEIKTLLDSYKERYNTKANQTIYSLMVIGLQAELQNILYSLSYSKLDESLERARELIVKYQVIASLGSASILPTVTKFLNELEPLFKQSVQVEYEYYVQKEREKEEQRLIREQMKQEAQEKKLLEEERKKIEKEEQKYKQEMAKNEELLKSETDESKIAALQEKLRLLQEQINKVEEEKEEITKRANGRAGYVYVISNLGSFGENMFKVGMTRRLNPQDRVDELGDASVPFKFDVHAMIFSDNAVEMEQMLHQRLDAQRVNKVNQRKEFFYGDLASLQALVEEIDETASFTSTMKALEYYQSQEIAKESDTPEHELTSA